MRLSSSLSRLELFVKIVTEGSLSKAGRSLSLTPSAVSKSLAQLESELGVTLIKRTSRHLSLTDCGATLFERAKGILQEAEGAVHEALRLRDPTGSLKVSCSIAFGCTQVSKMVKEFSEVYPNIELSLNLEDRVVDLASEEFDVALRITSREDWDFPGRRLTAIRWMYAASPEYLRAHPPLKQPEDLVHHSCLLYPAMTVQRQWTFSRDGKDFSVKVPCRAISNSSLALAEMAISSGGVVCIPSYVAHRYIQDGRLLAVLPEYAPIPRHSLYALYFKSRYNNPAVRAFVAFLAAKFASGAPWEALH
ncbi:MULTISPECIES: LysR family transcriptional regulator [unclassified Delftia]|uniref:LysR family transcriptional regulator n=1 Tax=unclassified Delftia TaxID=2613839 RepID=UPI0019029A97|nr:MULTISPECIES: LysR family transcriptional regulator [unclassified Delftia]MBK0114080.1 LysR family transcriptional regulator [Delftia sp. S65]MBK0117888.1 LysR family transcriptional regulator [Delftia sp. S67]MBK0129113.1 LysR family transcriptional regulator [Delftia sp. S66]